MSSMVTRLLAGGLLLASVAAAAATLGNEQRDWYRTRLGVSGAQPTSAMPQTDPTAEAVLRWNRLRQSDSYAFADYAGFLLAYPGWPGEMAMRKVAERRIDPNNLSPRDIVAFFDRFPPLSASAHLYFAEALSAIGRPDAAQAARAAWLSGALTPLEEGRLLGRYTFAQEDQDQRMERLLWNRSTASAARQIGLTSPARRPMYEARLAMQQRSADAADRAYSLGAGAARDAGFIADRARWLRDSAQLAAARGYLANPRTLDRPPFDPRAWMDLLYDNARAAAADKQWSTAWGIASQIDDAYPAGTNVRATSLAERDVYTNLVWLAGTTALQQLGRPADAVGMFERYGRAAKSPQTQTKGFYWAGRAALAAGDATTANRFFTEAAQHPDQFYGQLAGERLGRPMVAPQTAMVALPPEANRAFEDSSLVRAARILGELGDWRNQSLFLRTIAQNAVTDTDHVLAANLSLSINRPDLGVMVARNARNSGVSDFVPTGFPRIAVPATAEPYWTMVHAISRQESQFDRQAISSAGARGLMQLMPGTARDTAGKLGLSYDFNRLIQDPSYNIMLGSFYFSRLLDSFGGNHVLAVASYNAGPGNVRKWLAANGDPRMPGVDVINWIEAIPFSETRGYVQRVLENAVVYDAMNPARASMPATNRLSAYLGKRTPG
ncbi:MAG: lytic transglycosylase subunit [Sphingomonas bacterium]|nr:lytic transglycosylase subunit [Sphingomonas bacterium]